MLSEFNYYLDYLVKFFFINSKGNLLIKSSTILDEHDTGEVADEAGMGGISLTSKASESKEIYEKQIKRYFGFGFLASFIPGTEAFNARIEYFSSLLKLHEKIENNLSRYMYKNSHAIGLTPLFFLNNFVFRYSVIISSAMSSITRNHKISIAALLSLLPIVSDLIQYRNGRFKIRDDWYLSLGHSLINPIRLISSFLHFLHWSMNTVLELGAEEGLPSLPRQILKGLSAFIFIPLIMLASGVECTVDLVLSALDTLLLDPLRFVYEVGNQLIDTYSAEFIYEPTQVFNAVNNISEVVHESGRIYQNVIQSENYTLKIVSPEEKTQHEQDINFYTKMKLKGEFLGSEHFTKMTDPMKDKLKEFYKEQSGQSKQLNKFGMFSFTEDKNNLPNYQNEYKFQ